MPKLNLKTMELELDNIESLNKLDTETLINLTEIAKLSEQKPEEIMFEIFDPIIAELGVPKEFLDSITLAQHSGLQNSFNNFADIFNPDNKEGQNNDSN